MVHGWAMHSGIWRELAERLAVSHRVTLLDLPGHGGNAGQHVPDGLDAWADAVAAVAPDRAWWCGWSLGAQLCLSVAARYPQRVKGIIGIAGTPRFVAGSDWQSGISVNVLRDFAAGLDRDYAATVRRFLTLQVRGSDDSASVLRRLRRRVLEVRAPRGEALQAGLRILESTDQRQHMSAFKGPVLWLLGARDTLVPASLRGALGSLCPHVQVRVIGGAGHAPFLSSEKQCVDDVTGFVAAGAAVEDRSAG